MARPRRYKGILKHVPGPVKRLIASQRGRLRLFVQSAKNLQLRQRIAKANATGGYVPDKAFTRKNRQTASKGTLLRSLFGKPAVSTRYLARLTQRKIKSQRYTRSIGSHVRHEIQKRVNKSNLPSPIKMIANLPKDVHRSYLRLGKRALGMGRFKGRSARVHESLEKIQQRRGNLRDYTRVVLNPVVAGRYKRRRRV